MDFKKISLRTTLLVTMASLLLIGTLVKIGRGASTENKNSVDLKTIEQPVKQLALLKPNDVKGESEDDSKALLEMTKQMDRDREQQKQIKLLRLELEQASLQLEKEKAYSEINKLKSENIGIVKDSVGNESAYPVIQIKYIGGTATSKEAILSINGSAYSVKEKEKPTSNVEILSISNTAIKVHFNSPSELTTTIEYKPE